MTQTQPPALPGKLLVLRVAGADSAPGYLLLFLTAPDLYKLISHHKIFQNLQGINPGFTELRALDEGGIYVETLPEALEGTAAEELHPNNPVGYVVIDDPVVLASFDFNDVHYGFEVLAQELEGRRVVFREDGVYWTAEDHDYVGCETDTVPPAELEKLLQELAA